LKLLIAGSRTIPEDCIEHIVPEYAFKSEITEVVSGLARGADRLGENWAESKGLPVTPCWSYP
jgi:hypothetical protein